MVAHLVVWYLVFLFSVTFLEYAHARAAAALGDRTAYFGGYLTLDPMPHLTRSPFGLIVIPILTKDWRLNVSVHFMIASGDP